MCGTTRSPGKSVGHGYEKKHASTQAHKASGVRGAKKEQKKGTLNDPNVDRLLSLWSALNPDVWVSPGPAPHGSWTLIPKSAVDKDTDLTPFWKSQNSYWRSSEVTTTAAMGYTYPEFNGFNMSDPSAVRSAIAAKVVRLYG
ncbi:hypothetical protein DFH06DRAFT_1418625 [Mycena polygramma]|nr:hypothetical protein DFH06DRAFT_1418625 [Mycena polygramma]